MSVAFQDLSPTTNPGDALEFVTSWHGWSPGFAVVSLISTHTGRLTSKADTVPGLQAEIRDDGLERLVVVERDRLQQVYLGVSTHSQDPCGANGRQKGGQATVCAVPGVWLDLDVKDDSFASAGDIDEFLQTLPLRPTILVDSGSGGRHAYWAWDHAPVDASRGKDATMGWWALAQLRARERGVGIDRVFNVDRIMRLPGTVRWPKSPSEPTRTAQLLYSDGPRYPVTQVEELVAEPLRLFNVHQVETRRTVTEADQGMQEALSLYLNGHADGTWVRLLALSGVEDLFNSTTTWDAILIPNGWHRHDQPDRRGRTVWARPDPRAGEGDHRKSAFTDWSESPHVMALHSTALETGLLALKDAGVTLSKFRVSAQLDYGGDTKALTLDFLNQMNVANGDMTR